jgi:hypothetical protein
MPFPWPGGEGVRTNRWNYVRYNGRRPLADELFNLQSDPLEEHDLASAAAHARTLTRMSARGEELRDSLR